MKKTFKIIGFSLLTVLGLLLIAIAVAFWFVLTPKRITPFVQEKVSEYVTCDFRMDKADVTFFKTFPNTGVEINGLALYNDDTIVSVDNLNVMINIRKFLFNNEIIINKVELKNGTINIVTDEEGMSNLDFLASADSDADTSVSSEMTVPYSHIDLKSLKLSNINILYSDLVQRTSAKIENLCADIDARLKDEIALAGLTLNTDRIAVSLPDSTCVSIDKTTSKLKGHLADFDLADGALDMTAEINEFMLEGEKLAKNELLKLHLPFTASVSKLTLNATEANIRLGDKTIGLDGVCAVNDKGLDVNFDFATNYLDIENVLGYMPQEIIDELDGMLVYGKAALNGTITGMIADSTLPVVNSNVHCKEVKVVYDEYLPMPITNIEGLGDLNIDLYTENAKLVVSKASGTLNGIDISAAGTIDDLLYEMNMDLIAQVNVDDINKVRPFLPDDMQMTTDGSITALLAGKFNYDQIYNLDLNHMIVSGSADVRNLNVATDSMTVAAPQMKVKFNIPSTHRDKTFRGLADAVVTSRSLNADIPDFMNVKAGDVKLKLSATDFMEDPTKTAVEAEFDMASCSGHLDTIVFALTNPKGSFSMLPQDNGIVRLGVVYNGDSVLVTAGENISFDSRSLELSGRLKYGDTDSTDIFEQYDPSLAMQIKGGHFKHADTTLNVTIPRIKLRLEKDTVLINNSQVVVGNSDLGLEGKITGLSKYLKNEDMLHGRINLTSQFTDIDQIIELTSGIGVADSLETAENTADTVAEDNPFIVPKGMDVSINTLVLKAKMGDTELKDIGGKITVKDGVLVFEQMGFTTNAARMQLTALYKSPRRNHLFAGVDLHLLDIDIHELINMIPTIDTVVPMLKDFDGRAQFHFAIETYMKSNYELKLSTLRGAMSLEGKELVLRNVGSLPIILDKLKVTQKGDLLVDSLSCEMTVFRNEIDVYPFLISMQNYQAVVSGRHNLDMTFDYHIDIVDTPPMLSVARLGLDVSGNIADLQYKVTPSRYANLYKPEKRDEMQNHIMNFKKMISDSLKRNVKE